MLNSIYDCLKVLFRIEITKSTVAEKDVQILHFLERSNLEGALTGCGSL